MDVALQSRSFKHGLGWGHTETALGLGRVKSTPDPIEKEEDYPRDGKDQKKKWSGQKIA